MPPLPQRQQSRPVGQAPDRKTSVLDRIAPISFDEDDGIQMLLYGKSGTGKTTLWSSFPSPILSLVCSGGDKPGELRSINTAENRERIKQVTLRKSSEILEVTQHLRSGRADPPFRTVVLDHVSGLADMILAEILNVDQLPAQKTWGLASQQDYGQLALQAKNLLRDLLGLSKMNVIIVAQEREFNTDGNNELLAPFVGAGLTPSLVGWLNTAVDYICQTFIRQAYVIKQIRVGIGKEAKMKETREAVKGRVEYCLRTAPDPVYMTKFRQPKGRELPPEIVDPDYDKIMALIN